MIRIGIHDYGGHPFTYDLSEGLAELGYEVVYLYTTMSHGPNAGGIRQNAQFQVAHINVPEVKKEKFLTRFFQEYHYGKILKATLAKYEPDIIISSTTPLIAQWQITRWAFRRAIPSVFWFQDIISIAARNILSKRLGWLGGLAISTLMAWMEKRILKQSDGVITISDAFSEVIYQWGIHPEVLLTHPNWAVIRELPVLTKANAWASEQGLSDFFCFMYTGTLGMKHNPEILVRLAQHFQSQPAVRIVVISETMGADWLREQKVIHNLTNLIILPFQPFSRMAEVLATADVLISVLNEEASNYSVPSKILSYLCSARPIIISVPPDNQAGRMVQESGAGHVVQPGDIAAFISAAEVLFENTEVRTKMGQQARQAAERLFDRDKIIQTFDFMIRQIFAVQPITHPQIYLERHA